GVANEHWMAAQRRGETALRNAEVVHAMGMLPALLQRWHAENDRALDGHARAGDRGAAMVGAAKFLRLFIQVAILGLGAYPVARWAAGSGRARDGVARAGDRGAVMVGAAKFLRLFIQVASLGLGAYLVVRGELTGGGMIAGSILLSRALAPVEQAIGAWKGLV